ncbi:MAG: penicillin-binding protein 2 [Rhodobacterales bacterium]|nr:MAG: penicillin-binding protein 2 [Rhodobacterales bacterium]
MKRDPRDTAASQQKISRRGLILGASQLAFVGLLAGRMQYLQVKQADKFRLLADENRINIRLIPPARGLIYDRNGIALAINKPIYRISMVREDAGDVDQIIQRLRALMPLDQAELERALDIMNRRSPYVPVTIASDVQWDDIAKVAVNAPALPGVNPELGLNRVYPLADDFAHIVGYVGAVNDRDLQRVDDQDPLLQIPHFKIGKYGAEARLEKRLRGKAGTKRIEVNSVGRVMRELDRQEGNSGDNIQLSVDSKLQNYVQARLAGESAAAVVIDVTNGDLLAVGSTPAYDPNKFVNGISHAEFAALNENKYRPLPCKAVQGTYPPGSTFKMVTALAALKAGVVGSKDTVKCNGHVETGGRRFHCWKRSGHGNMNLINSLKRSCDVYYYEMAERTGIKNISAMARRLGLGEKYDLPMTSVKKGLTPTKEWKRQTKGADWVIGDSLNASIGQGFVLSSPLQLAVMTARIATGKKVLPRLVKSINGQEQPVKGGEDLELNENHLRLIRKGMFAVTNNLGGTGYKSRVLGDDYLLAGKTGTSQVGNKVVRNSDVAWEKRDHALFVCFAPYDNPRIAVSVIVEHGGGGSTAAAPIARDIVLQALYGKLPPLSAYPKADRARIKREQKALKLRDPSAATGKSDQA